MDVGDETNRAAPPVRPRPTPFVLSLSKDDACSPRGSVAARVPRSHRAEMPRSIAARLLALSIGILSCGDNEDESGLPRNAWTFVPVEGAACADGSPTGVAVNPGARDDVLFFLDGGGACLDYVTCFEAETASNGPFGEPEFRDRVVPILPGSPMDRGDPENPFREWTWVFVPYCTGDVFTGDFVASYRDFQLDEHPYRHVGRKNLELALPRLAALLRAPGKLVVSGASAGGFGAALNYDRVRGTWPGAKGYLVDDSGPLLVGNDIPAAIRAAWVAAWRADEVIVPLCPEQPAECLEDWSEIYPALRERWPNDRFALLSTLRDRVIRSFFLLDGAEYETAIRRLDAEVFDPLPEAETFLVPGDAHTFLGAPSLATAEGVTLEEWLRRMVEDDPAWTSLGP
jgi:hypothetical protein